MIMCISRFCKRMQSAVVPFVLHVGKHTLSITLAHSFNKCED